MSNNQTSTSGGIFLTGKTINPGEINMSFRISSALSCPVPEQPCLRGNGTPQEVSMVLRLRFGMLGSMMSATYGSCFAGADQVRFSRAYGRDH